MDSRTYWLERLEEYPSLKYQAMALYDQLEACLETEQQAYQRLIRAMKTIPAYRRLQEIPGIGPIISAAYICLIECPSRFSRRNKLWAYACLGNKHHESDRRTYVKKKSSSGCRPLKSAVFQQFNAAVLHSKAPNRFKRKYTGLLQQGHHKRAARREVCRAMLSTVRSIWLKGDRYIDHHESSNIPHELTD